MYIILKEQKLFNNSREQLLISLFPLDTYDLSCLSLAFYVNQVILQIANVVVGTLIDFVGFVVFENC